MAWNDAEIKAALDDRLALAGTAWAEARGDWREGHSSVEERIAVMMSVKHRTAHYGRFRAVAPTFKAVCLAPNQYSCWNAGGDLNHHALMALMERVVSGGSSRDLLFEETLFLADGVISGVLLDATQGADSYFAPKAMKPAGRMPREAKAFLDGGGTFTAVGDQLFYRQV